MIHSPRVSVITPFRDAESYLAEAILSVKAQTMPDWELILIDDGSTDNSHSIALEVVNQDSRIKLLDRPKDALRGAAAARNAGIQVGQGSFLAFLDADDIFEPAMLETFLVAADAHPETAMIYGPTLWWYPEAEHLNWTDRTEGLAGRLHTPPHLLRRLILMQDGHVPCTCSVLIRRSAIEAVGGFEESFRLYEDQTLWVKLFLHYPVYVIPVSLSRYRQHPGSVSAGAAEHGLYNRMGVHFARAPFLAWIAAYVAENGVKDRKLNRAIRLATAPYIHARSLQNSTDRFALKTTMEVARIRRYVSRALGRLAQALPILGSLV